MELIFLVGALGVLVFIAIIHQLGLKRPAPIDQLDAKRVQMEAEQVICEDGWIATEQARLVMLRQKLDVLRAITPRTEAVNHKIAEIHSAIIQADEFLGKLDQRKNPFPGDRRQDQFAREGQR